MHARAGTYEISVVYGKLISRKHISEDACAPGVCARRSVPSSTHRRVIDPGLVVVRGRSLLCGLRCRATQFSKDALCASAPCGSVGVGTARQNAETPSIKTETPHHVKRIKQRWGCHKLPELIRLKVRAHITLTSRPITFTPRSHISSHSQSSARARFHASRALPLRPERCR